MLPLTLDLTRLRLVLIGTGMPALRRLERLDAAGARALTIFAPRPSRALAIQAGTRLMRRMPSDAELAGVHLVFIAGLAAHRAKTLAERARALGAVVHVEDAAAISDVRMPAILHRGDLAIAVSTGGQSPGLAAAVKRALGRIIGPEWKSRLDQIAAARAVGAPPASIPPPWRNAPANGSPPAAGSLPTRLWSHTGCPAPRPRKRPKRRLSTL